MPLALPPLVAEVGLLILCGNSFKGKIEKAVDRGSTMRISVETGILFTVTVTRLFYRDLRLTQGKEVTEVHIF